jgi:hypothetical protein
MIANFAGYSFSKAHAAAFAVIVYWSAWLRVHYPVEYFCGLLRNAPLGTYPANVLESEARRVGVKFLPFDINRSLAKATVEEVVGPKGMLRDGQWLVVSREKSDVGSQKSEVGRKQKAVGSESKDTKALPSCPSLLRALSGQSCFSRRW